MDRTLKVSAIITGQTHQIHGSSHESSTYVDKDGKTHTSYYTSPYNATQTSALAEQLRPPKQPEVPSNIQGCTIWGIVFFLIATSPFWGMLLLMIGYMLLMMILMPFADNSTLHFTLNGNDSDITPSMPARIIVSLVGLAMGVAGLIIAFFVARAVFRAINAASKRSAEKRQREIADVQAEMARWEHAMQRWNQLYYCERDDLIFIPGEKIGVPREQMMDYIYQ